MLDEYANMKADAWNAHVRPSLSRLNRESTMDFIGVPKGRNHTGRTCGTSSARGLGSGLLGG